MGGSLTCNLLQRMPVFAMWPCAAQDSAVHVISAANCSFSITMISCPRSTDMQLNGSVYRGPCIVCESSTVTSRAANQSILTAVRQRRADRSKSRPSWICWPPTSCRCSARCVDYPMPYYSFHDMQHCLHLTTSIQPSHSCSTTTHSMHWCIPAMRLACTLL